jgi:hypothetical protein
MAVFASACSGAARPRQPKCAGMEGRNEEFSAHCTGNDRDSISSTFGVFIDGKNQISRAIRGGTLIADTSVQQFRRHGISRNTVRWPAVGRKKEELMMRIRRLGMSLVLALAVGTLPASPVSARSSHPGPQAATHVTQASQDTTPPVTVSPGGRVASGERAERREAFIVSPGFVGPAFFDPFWYGPAWGWWGPGPTWPGAYVTMVSVPPNMARLELHVRPRKADLVIDGTDVGEARDYSADFRPLWLSPGSHQVEIRDSGYQTLRLGMNVLKGQVYDLHYRLDHGAGIDSRSTASGAEAVAKSRPRVSS